VFRGGQVGCWVEAATQLELRESGFGYVPFHPAQGLTTRKIRVTRTVRVTEGENGEHQEKREAKCDNQP
jgi:hypothetical protein